MATLNQVYTFISRIAPIIQSVPKFELTTMHELRLLAIVVEMCGFNLFECFRMNLPYISPPQIIRFIDFTCLPIYISAFFPSILL